MNACVVDTNAIIYYLNRVGGDDYRRRFEQMVEDGAVISVISRLEVLGWPGYSGDAALRELLLSEVGPVDWVVPPRGH
ncbi:hypothetical protein [Methylomagnum ishizawai]|uniref:hypothetical protein n=1 Tax=Methylomagnum ishizawai TaxID=1760988 RepID=UPI001C335EF9|nr:hypothetical protein [Methylomagnum ishizawai]BBL76721.1 hypothetical protein MishRS11D_38190 [Methylomagnum ishizawai]